VFAKECAEALQGSSNPTMALRNVFKNKFLDSPFLRYARHDQKLAGALAVKFDTSNPATPNGEVFWAHTSDSMCLAYMSTDDNKPTALISRLPEGKNCGKCVIIESKCFSL